MSAFSNYFGKSDKGTQLYDVIGKMTEQERTDFLTSAETQKPGISEEYNVKFSMSSLGPESTIKDYGTPRGFSSAGLAGLSADIDAAEKNLIELEKGDIDEHLLTIEQMSGTELTNDYDSAFTYLKDAKVGFDNYIQAQKDAGASSKHIKKLQSDFVASYNILWPEGWKTKTLKDINAAGGVARASLLSERHGRFKGEINPELNSLLELNQTIEANQDYYNSQFVDPDTGEQSDIARALYELSQQ
jgi:hypothetical protein